VPQAFPAVTKFVRVGKGKRALKHSLRSQFVSISFSSGGNCVKFCNYGAALTVKKHGFIELLLIHDSIVHDIWGSM
jgi:hypothetical protein